MLFVRGYARPLIIQATLAVFYAYLTYARKRQPLFAFVIY